MTKVQPRTPSGFSEYLPDEQIEFNRLMDIIRQPLGKYGTSVLRSLYAGPMLSLLREQWLGVPGGVRG